MSSTQKKTLKYTNCNHTQTQVSLDHFPCETYENVIKEYAPDSKKRKKLNKVLGINIRDKVDESKVDTTHKMYPEYQKIWGFLNSIRLRNECLKRKKICDAASSTSPECSCPDEFCKNGPVSGYWNPFKKTQHKCNCVVKDDEMPAQISQNTEDFNVVNECFDETTGQPKSFVLRHYCKMPRTSVAIFPLDPFSNSRFYECPISEANKLFASGTKSIIGTTNDDQLLKACSNTIESIDTGNILGNSVPNCLKLTLRKNSVRRHYVCQLRNHCEDKSFVVTHTCSSSTPSQVLLSTHNDMGAEDEFSCSISDTRARNAWGSCVEIFRDFKINMAEHKTVTITNEELNTRTGTKRQKPWIEVPNDEVGAIVTLQGILDTTATSVVTIPKLHNRDVLPLFGGDMDCYIDPFYAYRQKRQICINQGCT